MAWTTSEDRARFFARYSYGMLPMRLALAGVPLLGEFTGEPEPPRLYRATVAPSAVLALLNERKEAEVIVDPAGLEDLTELDLPLVENDQ
jgi:hypothetical protein